jgi:hypothetical protein
MLLLFRINTVPFYDPVYQASSMPVFAYCLLGGLDVGQE